jgi:hypothetical protein
MRIPKLLNLLMAGFVYLSFTVPFLFLSGCSVTSPLLSTRANKASVFIIKPPMKIILSGEYSKIQPEDLVKLMKELRYHKYYKYNFCYRIIKVIIIIFMMSKFFHQYN